MDFKVTAIQFCNRGVWKGKFSVWWLGFKTPSWEPIEMLTGVDQMLIDAAKRKPNHRVFCTPLAVLFSSEYGEFEVWWLGITTPTWESRSSLMLVDRDVIQAAMHTPNKRIKITGKRTSSVPRKRHCSVEPVPVLDAEAHRGTVAGTTGAVQTADSPPHKRHCLVEPVLETEAHRGAVAGMSVSVQATDALSESSVLSVSLLETAAHRGTVAGTSISAETTNTLTPTRQFQSSVGYCALNSVALLCTLPLALYERIHAMGASTQLEQVSKVLNGPAMPCQLHRPRDANRRKLNNTQLLPWLKEQTSGQYAVEFDGHCVAWDADAQVITDTDAGEPVSITPENIQLLGIRTVELCYRVQRNKQLR